MKKAFTLIELLVVIAIIAILAAMLMPALARSREEARKAKCRSNVHNAGLAFAMFNGDKDGLYPGWVDDTASKEAAADDWRFMAWHNMGKDHIEPTGGGPYYQLYKRGYLDDIMMYDCPSYQNPTWSGGGGPGDVWYGPKLVGDPDDPATEWTAEGQGLMVEWAEYEYDLDRVSRNSVASRVFFGDGHDRCHTWSINQFVAPGPNHPEGANLLFIDGAVMWQDVMDVDRWWRIGFWLTDGPTVREWERQGFIPNPRMDEDDYKGRECYDGWVIGDWNDPPTRLLYPQDFDDVYAIEGHDWDCSSVNAEDPGQESTMTMYGGGCPVTTHYAWAIGSALQDEPILWWSGDVRAVNWWVDPNTKCFFPELGAFANEPRWETHDARLIPFSHWQRVLTVSWQ